MGTLFLRTFSFLSPSPHLSVPLPLRRYLDALIGILTVVYTIFVVYLALGPLLKFGSLKGLYTWSKKSHQDQKHGGNVVRGTGVLNLN